MPDIRRVQARPEKDGDCIVWPGELDFGADSLWYRAHPDAPVKELEVVKE
jgi:hypothetical protein